MRRSLTQQKLKSALKVNINTSMNIKTHYKYFSSSNACLVFNELHDKLRILYDDVRNQKR